MSDFANSLKRYKDIVSFPQYMKTVIPRNDKSQNPRTPPRKHDIANAPKQLAINNIDDLLASKFAKGHFCTHYYVYMRPRLNNPHQSREK